MYSHHPKNRGTFGTDEWREYMRKRDVAGAETYRLFGGQNAQKYRGTLLDVYEEAHDIEMILDLAEKWKSPLPEHLKAHIDNLRFLAGVIKHHLENIAPMYPESWIKDGSIPE